MMHGHDINLHADGGEQAKVEGEEMSSKVSVAYDDETICLTIVLKATHKD
jgi:hypothetical protein